MTETIVSAKDGIVRCEHTKAAIIGAGAGRAEASWAVSGIYAIIHEPTGRCYVGSAQNVHSRIKQHLSTLRRGHHNPPFQQAWDYDGGGTFRIVILEQCEMSQLADRERYWLGTLAAEFTRGRGGRWHLHSPATKRLLSKQRIGRPCPWVAEVMRQRRGLPHYIGDPAAWRAKLSAAMRGKKRGPHSAEWGAKIGEGNRRAWADLEARRLRGLAISAAKKAAVAQRRASGQPAYAKTAAMVEAHQRLSISLRGHVVSEATRQKISAALKGRPQPWNRGPSLATRAKMNTVRRGRRYPYRHMSLERRATLSARMRRNNPMHDPNVKHKITKAWAAPGYRERAIASMRLASKRPTVIANRRAAQKTTWADPVTRARRINGVILSIDRNQRSVAAKKQWEARRADPDSLQAFRESVRRGVTQWWASPEKTVQQATVRAALRGAHKRQHHGN